MRTISNFQNFYSFYSFITKQLHQYTEWRRVEKRWITLWVRVKYEGKNVEGGFGFTFFYFSSCSLFSKRVLVKIYHIYIESLNYLIYTMRWKYTWKFYILIFFNTIFPIYIYYFPAYYFNFFFYSKRIFLLLRKVVCVCLFCCWSNFLFFCTSCLLFSYIKNSLYGKAISFLYVFFFFFAIHFLIFAP